MKYSITVLQAEVTRFENAIKANKYQIKTLKNFKNSKNPINTREAYIKAWEKQIKELKADIAKL